MVTHHSVCLVRVMAFDVEDITCGTFSSPIEGVEAPTFAFIGCVVHTSCDAGHSTFVNFMTLVLSPVGVRTLSGPPVWGQAPVGVPVGAQRAEGSVHCPRAPKVEPSKGRRPWNRHSLNDKRNGLGVWFPDCPGLPCGFFPGLGSAGSWQERASLTPRSCHLEVCVFRICSITRLTKQGCRSSLHDFSQFQREVSMRLSHLFDHEKVSC